MSVIWEYDFYSTDELESHEALELRDLPEPHAYHINYQNFGYGKFKIDPKSLDIFAQ